MCMILAVLIATQAVARKAWKIQAGGRNVQAWIFQAFLDTA